MRIGNTPLYYALQAYLLARAIVAMSQATRIHATFPLCVGSLEVWAPFSDATSAEFVSLTTGLVSATGAAGQAAREPHAVPPDTQMHGHQQKTCLHRMYRFSVQQASVEQAR